MMMVLLLRIMVLLLIMMVGVVAISAMACGMRMTPEEGWQTSP